MSALMRQRALAKKLAKSKQANPDDPEASASAPEDQTEERLGKLSRAAVEGGLARLSVVLDMWRKAALEAAMVGWVENFGEELAMAELQDSGEEEEEEEEEEAVAEELKELGEAIQETAPVPSAAPEGESDESDELRALRERVARLEARDEAKTQDLKQMNQETLDMNLMLLEERKQSQRLKDLNQDLKRDLLAAQRGAALQASPASTEQEGSELSKASRQLAQVKAINKELQEELKTCQRELIALSCQEKQQSSGDADAEKRKLLASLQATNKELSSAQFGVLSMKQAFRKIQEIAQGLDEYEQDEETEEALQQILSLCANPEDV